MSDFTKVSPYSNKSTLVIFQTDGLTISRKKYDYTNQKTWEVTHNDNIVFTVPRKEWNSTIRKFWIFETDLKFTIEEIQEIRKAFPDIMKNLE